MKAWFQRPRFLGTRCSPSLGSPPLARFAAVAFSFVALAITGVQAQATFTWIGGTPADILIGSNWFGGSAPTSADDAVFGAVTPAAAQTLTLPSTGLELHNIAFTGVERRAYTFDGDVMSPQFTIGGAITVDPGNAAAGDTVSIGSGIDVMFSAGAHAIDVNGPATLLTIEAKIRGTGSLLKSGSGTLALTNTDSHFTGGLTVEQGTLELGASSIAPDGIYGPAGDGLLTLFHNTTLAATTKKIELHNDLALSSPSTGVTVTLDTGDRGGLTLWGDITTDQVGTRILLNGLSTVGFGGTFDGPANTSLTFSGVLPGLGSAGFGGSFTSNISSLYADATTLAFIALPPDTLELRAINGGYVGATVASASVFPGEPISSAALLARITAPANFAGTFGLDTDPSLAAAHTFSDALNLSNFTLPEFRLGSHSRAVVSGMLAPVDLGATSLYPFGGGSGLLAITSNLADASAKPASVLVSTESLYWAQTVVFRGNNSSVTGSYTLDGTPASLAVDRSIAILDAANALPGGSTGTFAFGKTAPAYVGYTEGTFTSFSNFVSHLPHLPALPDGFGSLSILGVDSHAALDNRITGSSSPAQRTISETIDLSDFHPIYLGSATNVAFTKPIFAPADGKLKLTAVDGGRVAVNATFGANVYRLELGMPAGNAQAFGNGTIELNAQQTYFGGTTLNSGTVLIGTFTTFTPESHIASGPLGTDPVTVNSGVRRPILAATGQNRDLFNPIVLNDGLQIGAPVLDENGDVASDDPNYFSLLGQVSGVGTLWIDHAQVSLNGDNSYSGGTRVKSSSVWLGSDNALGAGPVSLEGTDLHPALLSSFYQTISFPSATSLSGHVILNPDSSAYTFNAPVSIVAPTYLAINGTRDDPVRFTAGLAGAGSLMLAGSEIASLWIAGENGHTGGIGVVSGDLVFAAPESVPGTGLLASTESGYIGAAFSTTPQSGFLDRFNKPNTHGAIGFDSENQSVVTEVGDLDLSGFHEMVRLASSSIATIIGDITPADPAVYRFGNAYGTLTVTSALTDAAPESSRALELSSDPNRELTLVLRGTNTYSGGTYVDRSFLIFDAPSALPATGQFQANNYGYIGYTENVTDLTPAQFISHFGNHAGTPMIVGFDSAGAARTIADAISISSSSGPSGRFNPDTYLGTSTAVNLSGPLTPYTDTLKLTAVKNGSLAVSGAIETPGVTAVVIGTPDHDLSGFGSVTLSANNTYTGGTTLNFSHLILGHANALGTGALTNAADGSLLSVSSAGLEIANDIHTGTNPSEHNLHLTGNNSFTLAGVVSGAGRLTKYGDSLVTLTGNNIDLTGEIAIGQGSLAFAGNNSAGRGGLAFWGPSATAVFQSAAPNIGKLWSYWGDESIVLAPGSVLTVTQGEASGSDADTTFAGAISGTGASVVYQGPTAISHSRLTLSGASDYTGGTTLKPGVTVFAEHPNAFGAGTLTLDGGAFGPEGNSTLTNAIAFTANGGWLCGSGTFSVPLTIGSNVTLAPGGSIGQLNFASGLTWAPGGQLYIQVQDANGSASIGFDAVAVTGDLTFTATLGEPFTIYLSSLNLSGDSGNAANFNATNSYHWQIATADSLVGFAAETFNTSTVLLDTGQFTNDLLDGTFSLSTDATHLFLNFDPAVIPEPSTWALLGTGLALLAATMLRRKRQVARSPRHACLSETCCATSAQPTLSRHRAGGP